MQTTFPLKLTYTFMGLFCEAASLQMVGGPTSTTNGASYQRAENLRKLLTPDHRTNCNKYTAGPCHEGVPQSSVRIHLNRRSGIEYRTSYEADVRIRSTQRSPVAIAGALICFLPAVARSSCPWLALAVVSVEVDLHALSCF